MNASIVTPSPDRPLGIELSAGQLDALYAVGHQLYERADYERAAEVFRLLVLAEPLHVEAWQALGACHEQTDDVDTAGEIYAVGYLMGGNEPKLGFLCARARWLCGDRHGTRTMIDDLAGRDLPPDLVEGVDALRSVVEARS